MKTPTLEEVKEYFKNAKEVRSSDYIGSQIINIENYSEKDYETKHNGVIWLKDCALWDSIKGYAKIISYKDTYTVSKDFILEAHESACSTWKTKIENQFPELFPKVELELNKWYKGSVDFKSLIYITDLKNKGSFNEIKYYGFTFGDYSVSGTIANYYHEKSLVLATKEEVETALIKLLKDKYKKGDKVRCLFDNKVVTIKNLKISFNFERNRIYVNQVENNYTVKIFDNGKFAEIISEPIEISLDEIAEKFCVDVSLIKIKK